MLPGDCVPGEHDSLHSRFGSGLNHQSQGQKNGRRAQIQDGYACTVVGDDASSTCRHVVCLRKTALPIELCPCHRPSTLPLVAQVGVGTAISDGCTTSRQPYNLSAEWSTTTLTTPLDLSPHMQREKLRRRRNCVRPSVGTRSRCTTLL